MKETFRRKLSANTLQLIINQCFNLLVFYLLSQHLPKQEFGELNWTLAIFLFGFSLASFGFDQLVIQKTAAGAAPPRLLALHLTHVLLSGCIFYSLLLISAFLFPAFFAGHPLLLLIGLGKLLLYFSTPFKTMATGSERFRLVLRLSVSSAVLKGFCFFWLAATRHLSLSTAIPVFLLGDASELVLGLVLMGRKEALSFFHLFQGTRYRHFFRSALPQVAIVILAAALSRIDWILVGLFLSAEKLAEYSFAYKAFEVASLPLLVIAPLLVPYLTRLLREGMLRQHQARLRLLLKAEMMVASFVALCLNVAWTPVVDAVTGGKYGASNAPTIFLFSLALPVLYLNNFLWSLHFARGNLRTILWSFLLCLALNVLGNLWLLPRFGNEGAAAAYLLALVAQTLFYAVSARRLYAANWTSLLACLLCAAFSGLLTSYFVTNTVLLLLATAVLYVVFLIATIQLRKKEMQVLWQTIA